MITNHPSEPLYYGIHIDAIRPVQVSTISSPTGELFVYNGDSTIHDVTTPTTIGMWGTCTYTGLPDGAVVSDC
jgi:hypothetical protein